MDGRRAPEIKYNTHLGIREYSHYPLSAPPDDLSPAQIGPVKNRILVVCTKHSGRVLLQKGKFNDAKRIYQIGRTWDLDELRCITRVAPDAIILLLNKDYYWKSGEGVDRIMTFVHHLCVIYQKFTGKFPQLQGIELENLGLKPMGAPVATPSNPSITRSAPAPQPPAQIARPYGASNPLLEVGSNALLDHYKEMDFTVNGKLPQKTMQVMDVDRPSLKQLSAPITLMPNYSLEDVQPQNSQPRLKGGYADPNDTALLVNTYQNESKISLGAPSVEAQSFVFIADAAPDSKQMPTVSEYAQQTGRTLPMRTYKPERSLDQPRQPSESLEAVASYGTKFEQSLSSAKSDQSIDAQSQKDESYVFHDIDEIESVEDSATSETDSPDGVSKLDKGPPQEGNKNHESVIDDSIREIEDFMDTQFGKPMPNSGEVPLEKLQSKASHSTNAPLIDAFEESTDELISNLSYDGRKLEAVETNATDPEMGGNEQNPQEKDAEIEELLDEIGWNTTDGSDKCVKLLRQELALIKHKNVLELTALDFGKDTLANEVKTASEEVDNVVETLKKMETQFLFIGPRVNEIEQNSKGLQIEAVNKKILFNELSEVLNKVRLNSQDLLVIAQYSNFNDPEDIPTLEKKLVMLYDALGAIGSTTTKDDLSQMRALKDYSDKYEAVTLSFCRRFQIFICEALKLAMEELNHDPSMLQPFGILAELRKFFVFVGITNFVKCADPEDLQFVSDKFSSYVMNLLDNVLSSRIKAIFAGSKRSSRIIPPSDSLNGLRKTKSSRFGSTRILGRFAVKEGEPPSRTRSSESSPLISGEISDSRTIVRMVRESKELMLVMQYFVSNFFHSTSTTEFSAFVQERSFASRVKWFEKEDLDLVNYKTNSNELLQTMNGIFGNYINKFIRKMGPTDLTIPQLLVDLYCILNETVGKDQDFVAFSFVLKLIDRYRVVWGRFIVLQVELINKSDVRGKGEILPAVKNFNQIVSTVEETLQDHQRDLGDYADDIDLVINSTYEQLLTAMVKLFGRSDPLLKSNAHDEKEKAHRNVALLQNMFFILQCLNEYSSVSTQTLKADLTSIFSEVQKKYFEYLLKQNFGKMHDFVESHQDMDSGKKRKKEDRIVITGLTATYTAKEMVGKIAETHRKMEKHVVVYNTVFEQDLMRKMWVDMENEVAGLFQNFGRIAQSLDRDIENSISVGEIRRLFQRPQRLT